MKMNRRFFLISSFSFLLASCSTLYTPFDKDRISKEECLNKILKYLNYKKETRNKENIASKLLVKNNIININGWILTEREVLGGF